MKILFNLVLLFCSKDFILFYRDIQNRENLNEAALLAYFVMFFFKAVILIVLFCAFVLFSWEPVANSLFLNALFLGQHLLVLGIFYIVIHSQVRSIENLARAYSEGELVPGIIREKSKSGGKPVYSFKYTVADKVYEYEKKLGHFSGFDYLGEVGDIFPLIYAKSDPNLVGLYDKSVFYKRCLIKGKSRPDDLSKDEKKKVLAR